MPPLLDLRLTPNRSLDRRHARWLVIAVGVVFALGGLRLLVLGAWPVLPFMLADVALLAWAFGASYRSGTAVETVRLTRDALTVEQVTPAGSRFVRLDPAATRAHLDRISDLENRLWLGQGARRITVGALLSPKERAEVHAMIAAGLAKCRYGG